jgi:hypothetical protein
MYFHKAIMKDRQDELLQAAARHRLAAEARRGRPGDIAHAAAAPARRLVRLLFRRVPA